MSHTMNDFNNQAHQRSRSHQNDVANRDRAALRESGSSDGRPVARANIPDGHLASGPPKTANEGQLRPARQGHMRPANLDFHDTKPLEEDQEIGSLGDRDGDGDVI